MGVISNPPRPTCWYCCITIVRSFLFTWLPSHHHLVQGLVWFVTAGHFTCACTHAAQTISTSKATIFLFIQQPYFLIRNNFDVFYFFRKPNRHLSFAPVGPGIIGNGNKRLFDRGNRICFFISNQNSCFGF